MCNVLLWFCVTRVYIIVVKYIKQEVFLVPLSVAFHQRIYWHDAVNVTPTLWLSHVFVTAMCVPCFLLSEAENAVIVVYSSYRLYIMLFHVRPVNEWAFFCVSIASTYCTCTRTFSILFGEQIPVAVLLAPRRHFLARFWFWIEAQGLRYKYMYIRITL